MEWTSAILVAVVGFMVLIVGMFVVSTTLVVIGLLLLYSPKIMEDPESYAVGAAIVAGIILALIIVVGMTEGGGLNQYIGDGFFIMIVFVFIISIGYLILKPKSNQQRLSKERRQYAEYTHYHKKRPPYP